MEVVGDLEDPSAVLRGWQVLVLKVAAELAVLAAAVVVVQMLLEQLDQTGHLRRAVMARRQLTVAAAVWVEPVARGQAVLRGQR